MRSRALLLALAVGCSGSAARPTAPPVAPVRAQPRLVLLVVVDQLPTWVFERDRALFQHGFARLARSGAVVRSADIPYANPFTACGHATIGTGAVPRVTGILGNSWYRRPLGGERAAEHDPEAPPFSVGPSQDGVLTDEDAASGRALRVEGIADAHRRATLGAGKSIAISLKPRAAAFMLGKRPDLAVWYEAAAGGMTTTRAYANAVPPWLVELAKQQPATRMFARTWDARDKALLARITGLPDAAPGEGGVHGLDTAFPHPLAATDRPARAFLHTPFADELVRDAGLAAIDALGLGQDGVPDVLALGFNAHDYAGHLWGPESWEVLELALQLDRTLGELFAALDARLGADGWAVVVTSDHGMTPVVEQQKRPAARRVSPKEITRVASDAVTTVLGAPPRDTWVAKVIANNVYFVDAFATHAAAARDAALLAAGRAVAAVPGIAAAGPVASLPQVCERATGLEQALCHAAVPGESGELYLAPDAGALITDYPTGSHHDAPFDDNRRVPIFVMAPGLAPQASEGTLLQVAPTVAALLGIAPPRAATAPPLFGLRAR